MRSGHETLVILQETPSSSPPMFASMGSFCNCISRSRKLRLKWRILIDNMGYDNLSERHRFNFLGNLHMFQWRELRTPVFSRVTSVTSPVYSPHTVSKRLHQIWVRISVAAQPEGDRLPGSIAGSRIQWCSRWPWNILPLRLETRSSEWIVNYSTSVWNISIKFAVPKVWRCSRVEINQLIGT